MQARQSMAGGAAALLAGFSIAFIGVIAQAPTSIRWPGWSLLLLTLASALLVACVTCGFWARAYLYSHQEIAEWRPEPWEDWEAEALRDEQEEQAQKGSKWEDRAEWTYHLGIIMLAIGVGLVLSPPDSAQEIGPRWAAAGIAFLAGLFQGAWGMRTWYKNRNQEGVGHDEEE
ncbi:hypothetical protein [Streptomyces sp. NPDC058548]|uniref:hypothetical protein n=1 Tax=Streptomyces sp. NPDC058548 TaxID=3346545 RepID=UPI003653E2ED